MKKIRDISLAVLAATALSGAAFAATTQSTFTAQVTIPGAAEITTAPSGTIDLGSLDISQLLPTLTTGNYTIGVTGVKGTVYSIALSAASIEKVGDPTQSISLQFQDSGGSTWNDSTEYTTATTGVEETQDFKMYIAPLSALEVVGLSTGTYQGTVTITVTYS